MTGRPIFHYIKSCLALARYHIERGGNDLQLAKEILERVSTGVPEEHQASLELLKKLRVFIPESLVQVIMPGGDLRPT